MRGGGSSDDELPDSIDGELLSGLGAAELPDEGQGSLPLLPAPATPRLPATCLYLFPGAKRKADLEYFLVELGAEMGFGVAILELDIARDKHHDLTSDSLWASVV